MKKQAAQKKPRTKKIARPAEIVWHVRAQGLPIALFHTTVGPIIGHVERVDSDTGPFSLRLWAPAAIRMGFQPGQPGAFVAQYSVTFQPIALVETYLDLSVETPFGRSPVPEALVPAYADYLAKVAAGEYSFTRVTTQVQQAAPHEAPITPQALPWSAESDPHTWLTRRVYNIDDSEPVDRDDPRRVLVKRSFSGWAYDATPEKVATSFDLSLDDIRAVYDEIDKVLVSDENKGRVKTFLRTLAKDSAYADPDAVDPDVAPDEIDDENPLS